MTSKIRKNIIKVLSIALMLSFITANFSYSIPLCSMEAESGSCCCSSENQNSTANKTSQESFSKVCCCEVIQTTSNDEAVPAILSNNLVVKKDFSSNDNYSVINLTAIISLNKSLTGFIYSSVFRDIYLINSNLRI